MQRFGDGRSVERGFFGDLATEMRVRIERAVLVILTATFARIFRSMPYS